MVHLGIYSWMEDSAKCMLSVIFTVVCQHVASRSSWFTVTVQIYSEWLSHVWALEAAIKAAAALAGICFCSGLRKMMISLVVMSSPAVSSWAHAQREKSAEWKNELARTKVGACGGESVPLNIWISSSGCVWGRWVEANADVIAENKHGCELFSLHSSGD